MSNALTPRELAHRHADPACAGPTVSIEADVRLEGENLSWLERVLDEDETLAGVEVFEFDGSSLGVVPVADVLDYVLAQSLGPTRGGRVGQLEGAPVGAAPLFQCALHEPPYRRLLWAASPQLLRCKVCGQTLQRALP